MLFPRPTSARKITPPVSYGGLGWPGIRRVAVNLPSDVESTVNDGVDVVYRGDSHAL